MRTSISLSMGFKGLNCALVPLRIITEGESGEQRDLFEGLIIVCSK